MLTQSRPVANATARFASSWLPGHPNSTLNWRQKLAVASLQAYRTTLTRKQQSQSRKTLTGPSIKQYCRKHSLNHSSVPLEHAALNSKLDVPIPVLHFVTPAQARPDGPTIYYAHGGGYHNPIKAGAHIPFVLHCASSCHARRVVFLEYSLSPEQQYPCQLAQAVAGLRFLLEQEGISAENIILGGDSAGGHLIASLLTHIIHPSPYAAPIDLRGGQFKAVVLVSPWSTMSEKEIQALPWAPGDYLTRDDGLRFWKMFSPAFNEVWSHQCDKQDAVVVWKKLFPGGRERAICRRAILTAGTAEVLFESCVSFGRVFMGCDDVFVDGKSGLDAVGKTDFVLAIAPGEAHVQSALDCAIGYHDGNMTRAISAFLEVC